MKISHLSSRSRISAGLLSAVAAFAAPVSAEPVISIDQAGRLLIDATMAQRNDRLTLSVAGGEYRLRTTEGHLDAAGMKGSGSNAVTVPATAVTGKQIVVLAGPGDDTLTIDLSGGDLPVPLTYDGGDGGFDTLSVVAAGRRFGTATLGYLNRSDGTIQLPGNGLVTYLGLEPVDMTGSTATDFIFNLPSGADNAELTDLGGGSSRLASTDAIATFEQTDFAIPSGSITVNLGNGDVFDVTSLASAFPDLTISGGGTGDAVNLNTPVDIGPGNGLTITAEAINLNDGTVTTDQEQVYQGATTLAPGSMLTASQVRFEGPVTPMSGAAATIIGDLEFTSAADLLLSITGTTPGSDFGQFDVTGAVTLAGALTPSFGFTPADGDSFTIIDNDGGDSVSGAFSGLAEGDLVTTVGTLEITISYQGGTGNDVVLLATLPPDDGDDDDPVPVLLESFQVDRGD